MALMDKSSPNDGRDHIGPIVAENGGAQVMDCSICGFAHQVDLPLLSEVEAYYGESDAFYSTYSPHDWFAHEAEQAPYWSLVYADYLNTLAAYIDKPLDEPLSILDVGCGSGLLLQVARNMGWATLGVEPSPQARALCEQRGVRAVPKLMDVDAMRFDAAAMLLVLEHVPDPLGMLELVSARLVRNGVLLAVTPNDGNPLQAVARKVHGLPAWWVVSPHCSYFQPESLRRLMERTGFEVVDTRCSWPVETALLQGVQYVGNEELGRAMYRQKMAYETALYTHGQTELLRQMQRSYFAQGIGREIVMVGVKR